MASAEDARFLETTHGKTRKRELTTMRCRRRSRVRLAQPIQRSRHGSVFVAASNSTHPSLRPLPSVEVADVREGAPVAEVVVAVDERVPEMPALRVRHRLRRSASGAAISLRVRGGGRPALTAFIRTLSSRFGGSLMPPGSPASPASRGRPRPCRRPSPFSSRDARRSSQLRLSLGKSATVSNEGGRLEVDDAGPCAAPESA